ncbi:MAG TPA: glycoside hydrolase family 16 protein [Burkholderiaceae bacterium]|nr:glycoside hydrolase family 16 protein [Burkholderiaceae bacterium]
MRALPLLLALACAGERAAAQEFRQGLFFDDFSYASRADLVRGGWTLRSAMGHPGVPGAHWVPAAIEVVEDPASAGNRLLRLTARTDGTPAGTAQAQLCHQRKALAGTYAARVRFADAPVQGSDGDPVIQTFYAVAPLRFDFDPEFSEIDWEYLPNGGWGSDRTRLYGITWQTVRVEPWQAYNQAHEELGSHAGWHTLVMQVAAGRTHWFIDGRKVAEHGGRNYPVSTMAISFSLWFSPSGLLPPSPQPRVYTQEVDWVLHARNEVLTPTQVSAAVARLRGRATASVDTVPAAEPPLESQCDF